MSKEEITNTIKVAKPYQAGHNNQNIVDLICMEDVKMKPIKWLWNKRIAQGKVTVIGGQPGLGKSQITAMLCANITGQVPFPDGEKAPLGDVLILSAEDDPADTIKPRLIAAGADLKRCHFFNGIKTKSSGRDAIRLFDLSADADPLERILEDNPEIIVMIIDPVSAYQGKTDSHNNSDIRALLAPYQELATKYGVAIILVTHFNKSNSQEPIERFIGSIGLIAAARGGYGVFKDDQNDSVRYFLPIKNNIGNDKDGFAYEIRGVTLGNGIETSYVRWHEGCVLAQKILKPEKQTQINGAKEFLQDLLSEKPLMASEVFDEAEGMGYTKGAIQRAAKALNVRKKKIGMKGGWLWYLDGQEDQVTEIMKSSASS